jgi:hypothetical protein
MNYLFGNHDYMERGISQNGAFYPDCFETNRAGYLSESQKQRLILVISSWFVLAAIDLGILAWLIYFQTFVPVPVIATLFWSGFLVLAAMMCISNTIAIVEDLRDGRVKIIFGQVRKHEASGGGSYSRGGRGVSFLVAIRDHSFDVDKSVYDSIVEHKNYWLVYIPHSMRLVNIESQGRADEMKLEALSKLQRKRSR